MSTEPSKTHALKNEVVGTVQEGVGKIVHNEKMTAEGGAKKNAGHVEHAAAKAHTETKAAGNKVAGEVKDTVGDVTGHTGLQTEGKAQKAQGHVQSATNV
eukprot:TRINITY_DN15558_c0_g1_i1.p2 TRINITY_DN15558_c0_g1~~TRINITY_DN15558_c0_g1_i1.p2  ORF type:complete len:116 (-),score=25.50 TRINITY_DN15558_c0_g1_i1:90-389(-)